MKTTIDLPDDLMIEVKVAAARRRVSLRKFVEAALRKATVAGPVGRPKPFRWPSIGGDFAPGFDVSNREKMYAWLDQHRDRD